MTINLGLTPANLMSHVIISNTDRYLLRPRMFRGLPLSEIDTRVKLLGEEVAFPVCVSPMGAQCMVHHEGEAGTAKGKSD